MNVNQLKAKLNETYKNDEKITSISELFNNEDVNRTYLDAKKTEVEGYISLIEKNYNQLKRNHEKGKTTLGSFRDLTFLTERAVKASMRILYDKGLFGSYDNADETLKDYSDKEFIEVKEVFERRRPSLNENLNASISQIIIFSS